jgi:serine/threonine protein kinase
VMGTPYYMSPEQASGERKLDARVDLYACGVVMYEAVTGKRPFLGPNYNALLLKIISGKHRPASELVPGVPPAFEAVITRAMAARREDRYASAAEMQRDLIGLRASSGPVPKPPSRRSVVIEDLPPIVPTPPTRKEGPGDRRSARLNQMEQSQAPLGDADDTDFDPTMIARKPRPYAPPAPPPPASSSSIEIEVEFSESETGPTAKPLPSSAHNPEYDDQVETQFASQDWEDELPTEIFRPAGGQARQYRPVVVPPPRPVVFNSPRPVESERDLKTEVQRPGIFDDDDDDDDVRAQRVKEEMATLNAPKPPPRRR